MERGAAGANMHVANSLTRGASWSRHVIHSGFTCDAAVSRHLAKILVPYSISSTFCVGFIFLLHGCIRLRVARVFSNYTACLKAGRDVRVVLLCLQRSATRPGLRQAGPRSKQTRKGLNPHDPGGLGAPNEPAWVGRWGRGSFVF